MQLRFLAMRERLEEEPEPDEEPDVETPATTAPGTMVPSVTSGDGGREYEYRTELVTATQITDGTTLAEHLTRASTDGWDLVDIVNAGERHAILLRRAKKPTAASRQVGFMPPSS
jgi:hypothetical protein